MHQLLLRNAWTIPAGYEPPIDYTTGRKPADGLPMTLRALHSTHGRASIHRQTALN